MPVVPGDVFVGGTYVNDHTGEEETVKEIVVEDYRTRAKDWKVVVTDVPDNPRTSLEDFCKHYSPAWR